MQLCHNAKPTKFFVTTHFDRGRSSETMITLLQVGLLYAHAKAYKYKKFISFITSLTIIAIVSYLLDFVFRKAWYYFEKSAF